MDGTLRGLFKKTESVLSLLVIATLALSCAPPAFDVSSSLGRRAIVDETYRLIKNGRCDLAIDRIEPLYNSTYSDNGIRMARASAHACLAGVSFFDLISALVAANIGGSINNLWPVLSEQFPSNVSDTKTESSWEAGDALMAMLSPGKTLASSYQINAGTHNEGSTRVTDRVIYANTFLIFTSMSTIGTLLKRYSAASDNSQAAPVGYSAALFPSGWADVNTAVPNFNEEACSFAGAMITMVETISAAATEFGGANADTLNAIAGGLNLNAACQAGCAACAGAGGTANCTACPATLQKRDSCGQTLNDNNACAAAGIAAVVDASWQ